MYAYFPLDFSQIDPAENPLAAKSLSKSIIDTNMRRMKVNAQVTAVITLLEVFGNCVCGIIWIFITKFMGYATLIQGVFYTLYFCHMHS